MEDMGWTLKIIGAGEDLVCTTFGEMWSLRSLRDGFIWTSRDMVDPLGSCE